MKTTTKSSAPDRTEKIDAPAALDALATGVSQAALSVIIAMGALIGIWGLACLFVALGSDSGVLKTIKGYLTAIGM